MKCERGRMYYCGPFALHRLTGATLPEIEKANNLAIRLWRRKNNVKKYIAPTAPVRRMTTWQIEQTAERLGLKLVVEKEKPKTLRAFIKDSGHRKQKFIVFITGHFVVVEDGIIFDSNHADGVEIDNYRSAGKRVRKIWATVF